MSRPSAVVLGAGIAGLASAIALARAGWSVEILERAPVIEPAGAAIGLWANGMAGLRRLGAAERIEREAAPIARMLLAAPGGATVIDRRVDGAFPPTRALLQAALLERLGDVPAYAGYAGVVALSDPVAGRGEEGSAAEYCGRGERFGLFDLGGGRHYWFHMRTVPVDARAPTRDDLLARAEGWPGGIRAAIAATWPERLVPWPIHAKHAPRRLGRGRALCVGDAAHAMQPNLGQGGCQAIEDAVALGAAAGGPDGVVAAFEAMRLARVCRVVRRSAEGGWAAHGSAPVRAIMRAELRLVPWAVMERAVAGVPVMPDYGR